MGAPFDAVYHGGLEPTPLSGRNEDPSLTLQEGSWSSFGTQNGLPSVNYNYYSPLDDLGQPLPHYHSMRRMHLFLHDFSSEIVRASASTAPDLTPNRTAGAPFDGTTLRWQVRSRPPLRQASTANSTGSTVVLGLDAAPPHQPGKSTKWQANLAGKQGGSTLVNSNSTPWRLQRPSCTRILAECCPSWGDGYGLDGQTHFQ